MGRAWDSTWEADQTIKVGAREVKVWWRVVYSTHELPHQSVALEAYLPKEELRRLGFVDASVTLDSATRAGSKVDAGKMSDGDVYKLLRGKLKNLTGSSRAGCRATSSSGC